MVRPREVGGDSDAKVFDGSAWSKRDMIHYVRRIGKGTRAAYVHDRTFLKIKWCMPLD